MQKLKQALQNTKKSSLGEDTIFADIEKRLPPNAQEALLKVFNSI